MENVQSKPKLIYFMPPAASYPTTQIDSMVNWVIRGLSEFFELVVIDKDCDYAEVCETHRPDMAMFSFGVEMLPSRIRVTNTSAFPDVPKIGHMRIDSFSPNRSVFLSDMDRVGVETFFTGNNAMAEYTPEIANQLFYWPGFVDPSLFRDYGESKVVPLTLFGNYEVWSLEYHWRFKIKNLISKRYPLLVVPHPGHGQNGGPSFKIHGEQYARMINASMIVPTCGAMCKILVMKHLEIPAAKACLLTERTPVIEAYGFADMVNCVFADEHDVLDKLDYLFANKDVLERITNNGYELVHSCHTAKQRPQILQWLQLHNSLKAGQRIVQTGLFDDLKNVEEKSAVRNYHLICETVDRILLRQGDENLLSGQYHKAELLYLRCLDYIGWMPEPRLRLAICKLYEGNVGLALGWVSYLIKSSLATYKAADPDPVEWAYVLIALLCDGNLEEALTFSQYFPSLRHPELARARWAIFILANRPKEAEEIRSEIHHPMSFRKSIHRLPQLSFEEYVLRLCAMLRNCKQRRFARILAASAKSHQTGVKKLIDLKTAGPGSSTTERYEDERDISYLIQKLERIRRERTSVRLKERIKPVSEQVVPALARRINNFTSQNPRLKKRLKAFVFDDLKIQDW